MAGINPGRNVGRLSIRVIPDTNRFREDLKKRLLAIEKSTSMTVRVAKAKLDSAAIRTDIRRQMEGLKGLDSAVNVKANVTARETVDRVAPIKATMDRLTVDRLRRDLDKTLRDLEVKLTPTVEDRRVRQQLDVLRSAFERISGRLANDIMSPQEAERLRHRLGQINEHINQVARDREVRLEPNPFTAWASSRLAWLTRPRTVEIVVQVSKASVIAALTSLAALSGARLSWQWIDDLATSMRNLDKNLPSILGWTTGITSLIASLFAATSGLVGVGQGLFSILPAFLVLPGLLLNAVGSLGALVVALRNTKTELAPLKDEMSELGGIINGAFWTQARQPILDLVTGLMPQLRNSFRELSTGIGQFTGALATAFGAELSGGRLESIFAGIAEGWRILSSGAPAFAGAMTSLSQIAAKYTPRLATWMVRQANVFDTWLESVATDGRLDSWMETAIDSMYDLWDATKGVAGVFKGLWKAADAAGSKGLAGFADMMQQWDRVVNGADFQRGLTAIFRGSSVAMGAFGDAVSAVGRMILGLDSSIEKFIGSAGKFLGGLIEGAANALNTPTVDKGLIDLSNGLVRALEGILPSLPAIASTFGNFLGLLGDLAGTLLPAAANVLADLMPSIDGIVAAIRPALPQLSDAVIAISSELGPALSDFVTATGPVLVDALVGLADAFVDIAPVLSSLITTIGEWIVALGDWSDQNGDFFEGIREWMGQDVKGGDALKELGRLGNFMTPDDGNPWTVPVKFDFERMWNGSEEAVGVKAQNIARVFMEEYGTVLETQGPEAAAKLAEGFRSIEGIPQPVIDSINAQLEGVRIKSIAEKGDIAAAADEAATLIRTELETKGPDAAKALWNGMSLAGIPVDVRREVLRRIDDLGLDLNERSGGVGGKFSVGLAQGIADGMPEVARRANESVARSMAGSETWLTGKGSSIVEGLKSGADSSWSSVAAWFAGRSPAITGTFAGSGGWLNPSGHAVMSGLLAGVSGGWGPIFWRLAAVEAATKAVFGGSSGWLFGSGAAVIRGFISGLNSMWNSLRSAVSRVMSVVRDFFPHSPAKRGPFSGSGWRKVLESGEALGTQFTSGLGQGVSRGMPGAMAFDGQAQDIRKSIVSGVDLSRIAGQAPTGATNASAGREVNLHIHNPVVADLKRDAWEGAQLVGAVI